jgi:hypothetical protein
MLRPVVHDGMVVFDTEVGLVKAFIKCVADVEQIQHISCQQIRFVDQPDALCVAKVGFEGDEVQFFMLAMS